MKTTAWFERSFPAGSPMWMFSGLLERLRGTPARLEERMRSIPSQHWVAKPDAKWSIQENVGHLLDLEPLWAGRLEDLLMGAGVLRPTDLTNRATDLADHNAKEMQDLLREFRVARAAFVASLEALSEKDGSRTALHPRLNKPMNIIDKMLFVAEHDDHHLACISAVWRSLEA